MVFDWGYFKIYETTDLIGYLRGIYLGESWSAVSWGMAIAQFLGDVHPFILRRVLHLNV